MSSWFLLTSTTISDLSTREVNDPYIQDPKFSGRVNSLAEQQRGAMRQNKSKIYEAVINIQVLEAQAERHSGVREGGQQTGQIHDINAGRLRGRLTIQH